MPEVKTLSQINVLVAEHVMGWPHIDEHEPYRHHYDKGGVIVNGVPQRFPIIGRDVGGIPEHWSPAYTIVGACQVLDRLQGCDVRVDRSRHLGCRVTLIDTAMEELDVVAVARDAPVAICLAALKSVGIDVSVKEEG